MAQCPSTRTPVVSRFPSPSKLGEDLSYDFFSACTAARLLAMWSFGCIAE